MKTRKKFDKLLDKFLNMDFIDMFFILLIVISIIINLIMLGE